jgi:phage gp16-like protein
MSNPRKKFIPNGYNDKNRPAIIAKVHIAKKQLNMTDEDYRVMLQSLTGQDSTKYMTMWELEKVVEHMISLGFKPKKTIGDRPQAHDRQSKKIRALWMDLGKAGLVRDLSETALSAFVKRQTGVEALQWLSSEQACNVIEALKKWLGRAPSN